MNTILLAPLIRKEPLNHCPKKYKEWLLLLRFWFFFFKRGEPLSLRAQTWLGCRRLGGNCCLLRGAAHQLFSLSPFIYMKDYISMYIYMAKVLIGRPSSSAKIKAADPCGFPLLFPWNVSLFEFNLGGCRQIRIDSVIKGNHVDVCSRGGSFFNWVPNSYWIRFTTGMYSVVIAVHLTACCGEFLLVENQWSFLFIALQ